MILDDLNRQLKDFQIRKIGQADYRDLHMLHKSNPEYNAFFANQPISLEICIVGTKALLKLIAVKICQTWLSLLWKNS